MGYNKGKPCLSPLPVSLFYAVMPIRFTLFHNIDSEKQSKAVGQYLKSLLYVYFFEPSCTIIRLHLSMEIRATILLLLSLTLTRE